MPPGDRAIGRAPVEFWSRSAIIARHATIVRDRSPATSNHEAQERPAMQRVAFVLKVKPDMIAEYRRRHAAVWPEMLQALRETGWHNYSLFMREDGLLFGYLETPDFDRAREEMAKRDVNARWQQEMAP